jgi:hypothetical protein
VHLESEDAAQGVLSVKNTLAGCKGLGASLMTGKYGMKPVSKHF